MPRHMIAIRKRRGFTLVELLVTLAILGVVGAILAQLVLGQQRFFQVLIEQTAIRRELRTSLSVLPAELRSLSSSGGDLTALSSNSIQFRGLLGASIVCAKPAANQVDLPPIDLARHTLTSWYTEPVAGDTAYLFNEGNSRGAEDDVWEARRVTAVATTTTACPGAPYTDAVLDAGKRRFRLTFATNVPDSVHIGSGVRFYRHMRYELTKSSNNKYYLSRAEYSGGVWSAPSLISGPYMPPTAGGSGLRFRYFDSTGVEVTSSANAKDVARIDMLLRAEGLSGSSKGSSTIPKDSLSFRIALRNRH